MANLAERLLSRVKRERGRAGALGFRITRVYRVTRYKSGGIREVADEEVVEITEGGGNPPRVRWKTHEERAVGNLAHGAAEVGAITPNDALDAWLRGEGLSAGDERFIRLVGPQTSPSGDLYRVTGWRAEKPLRRMIDVEPVEQGFP